jgi:hypothetical protein
MSVYLILEQLTLQSDLFHSLNLHFLFLCTNISRTLQVLFYSLQYIDQGLKHAAREHLKNWSITKFDQI